MTAFPWLAGVAVCTVMVAVAYGIARLVAWAGHALPEWLDTEPTQTDDAEFEAAMRRHPAGKKRSEQ